MAPHVAAEGLAGGELRAADRALVYLLSRGIPVGVDEHQDVVTLMMI